MQEIRGPHQRFGRNRALVVGVNVYGDGISPLSTAVADATAVAQALDGQFEVQLWIGQAATSAAIRAWLDAQRAELADGDRLLIYLACHGVSVRSDGVHPDGHLLLADARDGAADSYLAMRELYRRLLELTCRHVMVILDCCFAGMFAIRRDVTDPLPMSFERYDQFVGSPAWQVLASAAKDQHAFDVAAERDDTAATHSPFARALLDGLGGLADLDANGLVTATELYWYVRNRVERRDLAGRFRQTPNLVPLVRHEHGEFVFQVADELRLSSAPTLTEAGNPYRGSEAFVEADAARFFGRRAVVADVIDKAARLSLTVVSGPPGAGKTSLLEAGVIPAFRDLAGWTIVHLDARSGRQKGRLPAGEGDTLVVIDHVEHARSEPLSALTERLVTRPGVHVVLAARSDVQPGPLQPQWSAGHVQLRTPSRAELRTIVVQPATDLVMVFEPDAQVEALLDEVAPLPAPLPLLSMALAELYKAYWNRQRDRADLADRALRKEDHRGLRVLLGELASVAVAALTSDQLAVARSLMPRLFEDGADGEPRPRRAHLADLAYGDARWDEARAALVDRWLDARILVLDTDERGTYLEAQLGSLRTWWRERPGGGEEPEADLRRDLDSASAAWSLAGQPRDAHLWNRDPERLRRATHLAQQSPLLVQREQAFVRASRLRRRIDLAWRWGGRSLLGVAAAGAIALFVAMRRTNLRNLHVMQVAQAGEHFQTAKNFLDQRELDQATASALAAVAVAPDSDPLRASYLPFATGLVSQSPTIAGRLPRAASLALASFHADGTRVAGRSDLGEPRAWVEGPRWREVPLDNPQRWRAFAGPSWSADGRLLVASMGTVSDEVEANQALVVWDAEGKERVRYAIEQDADQRYRPGEIWFCGDGCVASVVACSRGCVPDQRDLVVLDARNRSSRRVARWTTGQEVAIGGGRAAFHGPGLRLVELSTGELGDRDVSALQPDMAPVQALAFSPDGARIYVVTRGAKRAQLELRRADDLSSIGDALELDDWMDAAVFGETRLAVIHDAMHGADLVTVTGGIGGRTTVYAARADGLHPISEFGGLVELQAAGNAIVALDLGGKPKVVRSFGWSGDAWYARSAEHILPERWVGAGLMADGMLGVDRLGQLEHIAVEPPPVRTLPLAVIGEPDRALLLPDDHALVAGRVVDGEVTRAHVMAFQGGAPSWQEAIQLQQGKDLDLPWGADPDAGLWWARDASLPPPAQLTVRGLNNGEQLAPAAPWPGEEVVVDLALTVRGRTRCYSYISADSARQVRCAARDTGAPTASLSPSFPVTLAGITADERYALLGSFGIVGVVALDDRGPLPRASWHAQPTNFFHTRLAAAVLAAAESLEVVRAHEPETLRSVTVHLPGGKWRISSYGQEIEVGDQWLPVHVGGLPSGAPVLGISDDGRLVAVDMAPIAIGRWRGSRVGRGVLVFDLVAGVQVMWQPHRETPLACRITKDTLVTVGRDGIERSWLLPRDPARHPWLRMLRGYGWPIQAMPGAEARLLRTVGDAAARGDALAARILPRLGPPPP